MIYVDVLMDHGWKMRGHRVKNCHMFCDGDLEELHLFAESIGMKRSWFQNKRVPHYDLREVRRNDAVLKGAKELTRKEAVAIWKKLYPKVK
ncbi:hypothetical protein PS2_103 [Serratia phage PS2]|uniref:DUF4031 domain-containing protein n=1 Tax=Serratia phage PS2 TaxID=1481112 RepID=A0A023W4T9_9CAUD|nr:hypothetical protein FF83_gp103 [Serratia phage PS2]AHY25349.1 hypothetical protein PS2_103 [Serratia phage PS2]